MTKIKIHEFDPVIYPSMLWVVIDKEPDIISEKFKEYDGSEIKFVHEDGTDRMDAFTMPVQSIENQKYGVILFFRSKKSMTMELIAHEASHAAKYIFEHIGADITPHEPFEYIVGWIAGCCENVKNNVNKDR